MIKSPRESAIAEQPDYESWLNVLYAEFDAWNVRFFGAALPDVYLRLCPLAGHAGGLCAKLRPWQITIDSDLILHCWERDKLIIARSILIHELVHYSSFFVPGGVAINHTKWFAHRCNEIGRELGFSPVKSQRLAGRKRRGWPSCTDWPMRSQGEEFKAILIETRKRASKNNAIAMTATAPQSNGTPLFNASELAEMHEILLTIDHETKGAAKVDRLACLLSRVGLQYMTCLETMESVLPGGEMFKRP